MIHKHRGVNKEGGRIEGAAPWARAANFVKKPPLIVNVTYLELNGFNVSIHVGLLQSIRP